LPVLHGPFQEPLGCASIEKQATMNSRRTYALWRFE
jgi:hypothetical protein